MGKRRLNLNARFWRGHFREVFVRQIGSYRDVVVGRLLPTFANLDQEAERITNEEYERLGSMPSSGEGYDMGDAAEDAQ